MLKCGGRLLLNDPTASQPISERLRRDERLRTMCLSGALLYEIYVDRLIAAGFGQVDICARRPYRPLDTAT